MDFKEHLDPEIAAALSGAPPREPLSEASLVAVRAQREAMFPAPWTSVSHDDVRIEDCRSPTGVLIRIHRPPGDAEGLPCLYWLHAGGYLLGSFRADEDVIDRWVRDLGCVVASPDYRLAPEHPFPAALDDSADGLRWLAQNASRYGVDTSRIVVMGISAGGGLAASLAQMAGTGDLPNVTQQVLMYPMLDDRLDRYSSNQIESSIWDRESSELGWRCYLGQPAGGVTVPKYAVPARAEDLKDAPEAFIGVGNLDVFRDECLRYGQRLLDVGVPTELHVYPGAPHGFDWVAPSAAVSRRCRRDVAAFIRRAFDASATPTPLTRHSRSLGD